MTKHEELKTALHESEINLRGLAQILHAAKQGAPLDAEYRAILDDQFSVQMRARKYWKRKLRELGPEYQDFANDAEARAEIAAQAGHCRAELARELRELHSWQTSLTRARAEGSAVLKELALIKIENQKRAVAFWNKVIAKAEGV